MVPLFIFLFLGWAAIAITVLMLLMLLEGFLSLFLPPFLSSLPFFSSPSFPLSPFLPPFFVSSKKEEKTVVDSGSESSPKTPSLLWCFFFWCFLISGRVLCFIMGLLYYESHKNRHLFLCFFLSLFLSSLPLSHLLFIESLNPAFVFMIVQSLILLMYYTWGDCVPCTDDSEFVLLLVLLLVVSFCFWSF